MQRATPPQTFRFGFVQLVRYGWGAGWGRGGPTVTFRRLRVLERLLLAVDKLRTLASSRTPYSLTRSWSWRLILGHQVRYILHLSDRDDNGLLSRDELAHAVTTLQMLRRGQRVIAASLTI